MTKKWYYAVANGRSTGVYDNWASCQTQVKGYSGAKFKKFATQSEAIAFARGSTPNAALSSSKVTKPSSSSSRNYNSSSRSRISTYAASNTNGSIISPQSAYGGYTSSKAGNDVYTDGACRGNGHSKSANSGYGVYYGENDPRNVAESLSEVDKTANYTNQRAELWAIKHALANEAEALRTGTSQGPVKIHSDSSYSIGCMTQWRDGWKKKSWKTANGQPVKNLDLIEPMSRQLDEINQVYEDKGWGQVQFVKVKGHSTNIGNNRADELANEGADKMAQQK
ncbi:hypothetical protein DIURU_003428 [Diutina rugosa]|uniref:Ribonuclease H n=1 Tax=Diutina rugosa TaxID=5481 RepID=A0A642UL34_DIURU|nr:uncharacterized protein DIURU_003428 [Diutina rugosa]KAA8901058.1 hypothetical protein DIURU_003428 [Diutina rugosa]